MKKILALCMVLLLNIAVLSGCGCSRGGDEEYVVYKEGGAGVISLPLTHFDTFNPVLTQSDTVLDAMSLVYDSLYRRGSDGVMAPELAVKTEISGDGLVYTVHLRDDVLWHDGETFCAYDVSYTLSAIEKAENSKLKSYLYGIADYTAKSNFVFEIELSAPNSCFVEQLDFPVLQRGTDCSAVQADYVPVGTSAYRYAPTAPGKAHVLEKNPTCVTRKEGKIAQVVLKEIPSADNVMYALESREIEAVHVTTEQLRTYSPKGNVTTFPYTNRRFTFLGIRAEGVLADKQVRRAISLVLNREEISKNAMFGRMTVSDLPFLPGSAYNMPVTEETNVEDPTALLEAAGYRKATDGRWQKETEEGAQRLYVSILVNQENEVRCAAAEEIVKQLNAFGIGADVVRTDFETYQLRVEEMEYSMFLGETILGDDLDVSIFVGADARFASPGSAYMDELMARARTAVVQSDKDATFVEIADAFADEMPVISIGFGQDAVIVNDRIAGEIVPVYGNPFASFFAWDAK